VAAYVAGIDALLVLTKSDLRSPDDFLTTYAPLGLEHVVTHRATPAEAADGADAAEGADGADGAGGADRANTADPSDPSSPSADEIVGLEALRERLAGRVSVLIGHSGVGKSTLLNALVPGTDRAIGVVNDVTGRGRHTSSSALAMPLPDDDGWVIDTPGVRSFGLGHVDPDELLEAFADLADLAEKCPRGCTHLEDAPDCALDDQVDSGGAGSAGPARLRSYRRLAVALRKNDPWES
jgi:ribosome biogenesis GTPase / thiamine phosphate phosphatase